ncbi:hypothetical protein [Solicola sp. PLA-1-18]
MDLRSAAPDVVRHRHAAPFGLTPDALRGPGWVHPSSGVALVP